jgi:hypothetical protein
MNWQLLLVALIVAGAALYLGRQTWRTWSGKKAGCGGGCGCAPTAAGGSSTIIPPDELTLRLREKD